MQARLETTAQDLGLEPPSTDTHLSALNLEDVWILYLWSLEQDQQRLEQWLEALCDFQQRPDQTTNHVLAAQTEDLPPHLQDLFTRFETQSLILRTDGSITIALEGSRGQVQDLLDDLDATLLQVLDSPPESEGPMRDPLTEAEREALLAAYKSGYFEVPRRLRQSELAQKLGKSTGALSTLLRRATGRLVEHYARDTLRAPAPKKPPSQEPESESPRPPPP